MIYVFLVPKKLDSWSKNVISGESPAEKKFFWKIFIASKDSSLNFRGSPSSYFWAIVLISAVISILVNVDSLLQARTVTVKATCRGPLIFKTSSVFTESINLKKCEKEITLAQRDLEEPNSLAKFTWPQFFLALDECFY